MSQTAQAKVPSRQDAAGWELARVPRISAGEIRLLHRLDPGRAHRRLVEYEEQWSRAMEADRRAQRRMAAGDPGADRLRLVDLAEHNPDLKRALSDYREVVKAHSRAVEAAWAEHHHLLERASCAGLRAAAAAHNGRPTWQGLGVLQRSALVIDARRRAPRSVRPRTARTSPRIRRAAARRAAGVRSGQDPGPGEGDGARFPALCDRIWAEVRERSDEQLERYFRGECS